MNKVFYFLVLSLIWISAGFASASNLDQSVVTYSGVVLDAQTKDPLIGAAVLLKGDHTVGAATDLDGNFTISVPKGKNVVFEVSYVTYKTIEISPNAVKDLVFELESENEMLEATQVIAYGTQRKTSITGAITSVYSDQLLKSPSGSATNTLAGALSGVSSIQVTGEPGANEAQIYVRGTGSLTAEASKPLVLVDGVERSFSQMDPNEIASITVLKDAASTAVFGVRGANGVILVTTKRGEDGKNSISWSSSFGVTQPIRHLTGVDSYTYAKLYTETQLNDNPNLKDSDRKFSDYVTEMFRTNADPIMFPNINWDRYIFKDFGWQTQHNVTMQGGSKRFKYFVSVGYLHEDGIMNEFDMQYNANYTYDRYNYRANVDIDLTNTTNLKINLAGIVGRKNEPISWDIWSRVLWAVPFSSPGFVDGHHLTAPTKFIIPFSTYDGLDLYYNWGHEINMSNTLNMDLQLDQNLDAITKGLTFNVKGAYNAGYSTVAHRNVTASPSISMQPAYLGHFTQPGMDISDPMYNNEIVYVASGLDGLHEPMSYGEWSGGHSRNWYIDASLNYNRKFGEHAVTGLLLYNQSKYYYPGQFREIPSGYVGYVGRVTYSYKNRYLADFNVGYNGSENFAPGKRYGLFPAGSVGWIISEEPWMASARSWMDFFKLRASYGLVGNDKYSGDRFLYLPSSWTPQASVSSISSRVWSGSGSWQFGRQFSGDMLKDAYENTLGNPMVTWEKTKKQNYGLDAVFFKSQLNITADVFFEHRYDILSKRNTLPAITDISLPLMNLGIVDNHGYELSVGWTSKIREFNYSLKGNLSYSKNKIIYMDEVVPNEPYMAQTGLSTGLNYGYLFDRFLNETDFDSEGNLLEKDINGKVIPTMPLGKPRPGDSLFKDLNDDGQVDGDDCTYFGYGTRPDYVVGIITDFSYKGFGLSMQWTGGFCASRMLAGDLKDPFGDKNEGALMKYLADYRWTPENAENARFPRLTIDSKSHYTKTSDLWLLDASYLRLKTVELSYSVRKPNLLKKLGVQSAKVYVSGYNMLTLFSDLVQYDIDPEGNTDSNYNRYPNNRIFSAGFNLTF